MMYGVGNRPGHSEEKIDPPGGDGPENWAVEVTGAGSVWEADGGELAPRDSLEVAYPVAVAAPG